MSLIMKRNKILFKDNILLFIYIISNYSFLLIRDACHVSINKYIIIMVSSIFLYLMSNRNFIRAVFFTLPLLCGMPANYIVIIILIIYLSKFKKIDKEVICIIPIFFLVEIFNSFVYSSFIDVVGYIAHLCMFFLLVKNRKLYFSKSIIQYFICGVVATFSIIFVCAVSNLSSNWQELIVNGWLRLGYVYNNTIDAELYTTLHPNMIGNYAAVSILCSLILIKDRYYIKLNLVCISVCLLCLMLSFSRSAIITLAIFTIFYLMTTKKFSARIRNILLILSAGMLLFVIMDNYFPEVTAGLIYRFTDSTMSTGNNRSTLFVKYFKYYFSDFKVFCIGTGVTSYTEQLIPKVADEAIHNSLVQLLICYGLPLTLIFILVLIKAVMSNRKKIDLMYYIPLLAGLFFSFFSQLITPYYCLFPLLIGIALVHVVCNEKAYH